MNNERSNPAGVQELIDRLRDEGVAQGQNEADALIKEARKTVDEHPRSGEGRSRRDPGQGPCRGRTDPRERQRALRLASRDVMLKTERVLSRRIRSPRSQAGRGQAARPQLPGAVDPGSRPASHCREDPKKPIEVLLPAAEVNSDELRADPATLPEGSLSHFVLGLAADVLREGLTFGVSDEAAAGVHIRLVEDDVEIELSDETVTALLMQFMVPRFRAILDQ